MRRAWLAGVWAALVACQSGTAPDGGSSSSDAGEVVCLRLPEVIDFAEVVTGMRAEQSVTVSSPRTIFRDSFSVSRIDPPFGLNVLQLNGNQLSFRFSFTPPDSRLQIADFAFTGGAGCEPQTVRLRGLGGGGVTADVSLDFGSVALRTPTQRPVVVRNSRRIAINVNAGISGDFSIEQSVHIAPGASGVLMVTADLPTSGLHLGTASLAASTGEILRVAVQASGGLSRLSLTPQSLDFGHVAVLSPSIGGTQRRVAIQNLGDGPLQVEAVSVVNVLPTPENEVFVRSPFPIPPLGTSTLVVQLNLASPGPRQWVLRLTTNDPSQAEIEFPIFAVAENIAPCSQRVEPVVNPLNISGPFPRDVVVQLSNPNPGQCLLDGFELTPGSWTGSLPGQFFIDGGALLDVPLSATGPGSSTLSFFTVGTTSGSTVWLVAQ